MALVDSIPTAPDPWKVGALVFGQIVDANNERKTLELAQAKQVQDSLLKAEELRIRERLFGLDIQKYELDKRNTESLIAERERNTSYKIALADKELELNGRLSSITEELGKDPFTVLDMGTPAEQAAAWEKLNAAKADFGGFDSAQGVRRFIDRLDKTKYAQAKMQQEVAESRIQQEQFARTAGQRDESNQIRRDTLNQTKVRDSNNDANSKARINKALDNSERINVPGGGTTTLGALKRNLAEARLNPSDNAAQQRAMDAHAILNTVYLPGESTSAVKKRRFSDGAIEELTREGVEMIRGSRTSSQPADKKPTDYGPGPAMPTDPVKAAADVPLMPEEMPLLDSFLSKHKLKLPRKP